ncbi:hypothetical protein CIG75_10665 [Tumebacillus algifaecis]|uniref:Uncharacterized protein n=1 Tax=Tumebacillus algifaecis TaxID=1214604 RepID=A0A223D1S2_9BACL|nr:hypothetical protein CIG75_10665 [Tumebacillus algifaecis]
MQRFRRKCGIASEIRGSDSGLHLLWNSEMTCHRRNLPLLPKNRGVRIYRESSFYEQPPTAEPAQVLLCFAGLGERRIREGIHLLSKAWFE